MQASVLPSVSADPDHAPFPECWSWLETPGVPAPRARPESTGWPGPPGGPEPRDARGLSGSPAPERGGPAPDHGGIVVGPLCVHALVLSDGDVFPGGESVVATRVDVSAGTVTVFTDDGEIRYLGRHSRVILAYRTHRPRPVQEQSC